MATTYEPVFCCSEIVACARDSSNNGDDTHDSIAAFVAFAKSYEGSSQQSPANITPAHAVNVYEERKKGPFIEEGHSWFIAHSPAGMSMKFVQVEEGELRDRRLVYEEAVKDYQWEKHRALYKETMFGEENKALKDEEGATGRADRAR